MRLVPVILLACLPLAALAAADKNAAPAVTPSVELVRLWPGYRTAESFDRIAEYFTNEEKTGGQIILRTQPKERAGYYFLLRVKNASPLDGASIGLDLITDAGPRPKTHTFALAPLSAGKQVLNIGVTGADWPGGPDAHPVAWRLRLLAPDGRELLSEQSFLWGRPVTPKQ
ncbi:hypothetical protein OH491_07480 [Termitidicoccus mucosus]|uniref:Uncharacterized protein n=1 Tax=Termitidicoccus mucosus TaxID=1184151 RepID=A0A178ID84_9BACT|nr:hypothetical protein AW736_21595 [Opitutaceae bacterium TSB47]